MEVKSIGLFSAHVEGTSGVLPETSLKRPNARMHSTVNIDNFTGLVDIWYNRQILGNDENCLFHQGHTIDGRFNF